MCPRHKKNIQWMPASRLSGSSRSSVASETWATSISRKVNFLYRLVAELRCSSPILRPPSPSPVVLVVFALRSPSRTQLGGQRRTSTIQLCMAAQSCLVGPALQQRQFVGVHEALKDLELLAPGFFHHLRAPRPVGLRQLRALSGRCGDRYNESDCHRVSSYLLVIAYFYRYDIIAPARLTINTGDHGVSLATPSED